MHKLPGSQFSFTLNQIRDQYGPADWFPGDHPQMPDVVAHGYRLVLGRMQATLNRLYDERRRPVIG